jgi:hypothetical protein
VLVTTPCLLMSIPEKTNTFSVEQLDIVLLLENNLIQFIACSE